MIQCTNSLRDVQASVPRSWNPQLRHPNYSCGLIQIKIIKVFGRPSCLVKPAIRTRLSDITVWLEPRPGQ